MSYSHSEDMNLLYGLKKKHAVICVFNFQSSKSLKVFGCSPASPIFTFDYDGKRLGSGLMEQYNLSIRLSNSARAGGHFLAGAVPLISLQLLYSRVLWEISHTQHVQAKIRYDSSIAGFLL